MPGKDCKRYYESAEEELGHLASHYKLLHDTLQSALKERDEALAVVDKAEKLLNQRGRHLGNCKSWLYGTHICGCELNECLAAIKSLKEKRG